MSLLSRLLGKKPASEPHHAVVMVLLPEVSAVDGEAVMAHLRENWGELLPPLSDLESTPGAATSATIPGGALGFIQMPVPIPPDGLEGPVALAWHWPEASEAVAAHRSHVIVHVGSTTLGRLQVRLLMTRLAAAIVAVTGASGVYVGDAMLIRSAADYLADAGTASEQELPILSWIGFNLVGEEDGGLSGYTTGLTSFGLLELEARDLPIPEADLAGTLADLAHYQLQTGKTLKHGDTFGASAEDRTRVTHEPSRFIPDMTVAVLALGGAG